MNVNGVNSTPVQVAPPRTPGREAGPTERDTYQSGHTVPRPIPNRAEVLELFRRAEEIEAVGRAQVEEGKRMAWIY